MKNEDDAGSGRPKVVVMDENIKQIPKFIVDYHTSKLVEIFDALKISKKRIRKCSLGIKFSESKGVIGKTEIYFEINMYFFKKLEDGCNRCIGEI